MITTIHSDLLKREQTIAPLAFSIRDAATALGVGRTTVYRLISEGQLAVIKVGNRTLIEASALAAFMDRGGERDDEPDQSSALKNGTRSGSGGAPLDS